MRAVVADERAPDAYASPVIGIGTTVYALRLSPTRSRHIPRALASLSNPSGWREPKHRAHQPQRSTVSSSGAFSSKHYPRAATERYFLEPLRPQSSSGQRPISSSPPVLAHQSYLARVAVPARPSKDHGLSVSLSRKLEGKYRKAWLERELERLDTSLQPERDASHVAAAAGEDGSGARVEGGGGGASAPARRSALEEGPRWDPDLLHDHILGCEHVRIASLGAIHKFAEGMLPERALIHRHLHPLRLKLRGQLALLVGALRLATLDLAEALAAWLGNAGARTSVRDERSSQR
jgi:hypothetical protein